MLPLHDSRTTSDGITYNLVTTPEQLADVQDVYSAEDEFTYDVETIGEHRGDTVRNDIVWLSMACGEPGNVRTDVIPMGHPNGELLRIDYPILNSGLKRRAAGLEVRPQDYSKAANKGVKVFSPPPVQLSPGEVWGTLKPLFTSEQTKIGHGLKFDLVSAAKYLQGEIPSPPYADTLVMASILDNRHHFHLGLDDCSARELKYHMVKGLGKNVALATFSDTADYSAIDANKTHLLKHKYAPKIKRDRLTGIFNLEMDLLEVLADMELEGAPVDIPALQVLYDRLAAEIEVAEARVFAAAGRAFNMNSNPEKQNLLYAPKAEGGQGLRPRGLTDTGKIAAEKGEPITIRHYSTDSDALEPYRGKNRLVDEMLAYTELDKLQSTYVIPYLGGEVTHTTGGKSKTTVKDSMLIKGRIHTDFVQYGAETGRMSSRHPNLQNVPNPKKSENGLLIRNLFIAPPGYSLVQADYSQIEPRIIASFSKDRALIHNYLTGGDVYVLVGDSMSVDRAAGKVLVLAISYGIGPDHIAKDIGCTSTAARDLMNRFNRNFPSIEAYKKQVIQEARLKSPVPYVTTLLGRRRYLPLLRSTDYKEKSGAERQCFNTKIQGTGADIIKLAMVRAHRLIPEGARMILTVHDEIVILTPNHLIDETSEDLREAMEGINVLSVPLTADIHVVTKWGDAK